MGGLLNGRPFLLLDTQTVVRNLFKLFSETSQYFTFFIFRISLNLRPLLKT
jgi:hypothetical protein